MNTGLKDKAKPRFSRGIRGFEQTFTQGIIQGEHTGKRNEWEGSLQKARGDGLSARSGGWWALSYELWARGTWAVGTVSRDYDLWEQHKKFASKYSDSLIDSVPHRNIF
jgi:hypothetical protein